MNKSSFFDPNMRTSVLAQSDLIHKLQGENEVLRSELERIKEKMNSRRQIFKERGRSAIHFTEIE